MDRKVKFLFAAFLALSLFTGCSGAESLPARTSAEADLYRCGGSLCSSDGQRSEIYALDSTGNALDTEGRIYIARENLRLFTWAENVSSEPSSPVSVTLSAGRVGEVLACREKQIRIEIALGSCELVNRTVFLESTDSLLVSVPLDSNSGSVMESGDGRGKGRILFDEDGKAVLQVRCRMEGTADLIFRNCFDEEVGRVTFVMTASETEGTQEAVSDAHVHQFADEIVEPTEKSPGCTVHSCTVCGFSYRDSFTSKKTCVHRYTEKTVPPTYTEQGYTVHSCPVCGDSYRDSYTDKLTCLHERMKETVTEPTCTMGGYTLHECVLCGALSYKDSFTEALGHSWDDGTVTQAPACAAHGIKTLHCTRCAATAMRDIPPTGRHSYDTTTVSPTCTENGYDLHICSVCGDRTTDHFTPLLGHAELRWEVTQQPDCGMSGVKAGICTRCGSVVSSDILPAAGNHSYEVSVTASSCERGGYTEHRCSVCGDSFTDSETEPLGHDWIEKTERVQTGTEVHTFCSVCGFDFTANGGYNSAHSKTHALNGEGAGSYQTAVPKYEDVTTVTCSRCGKTK